MKTDKTTKKNTTKRPSKCAFIDSLLEKGGMTMDAIAKAAHKKFGGSLKSTMATCNARPYHMRSAGRKPQWLQAPKEAK